MARLPLVFCLCVCGLRVFAAGSDLPAPFHAGGGRQAALVQNEKQGEKSPLPISEFRHVISLRHDESFPVRMQAMITRLTLPDSGFRLNVRDNCVGVPTASTPYDNYMQPVHRVFDSLAGGAASVDRVGALMKEGRKFAYVFNEPYMAASPERTARVHRGDCKSKSLWLCQEIGDSSLRFVVGRLHKRSRVQHAWLYWRHSGRWWILDCTTRTRPVAADSVGMDEYIPYYSYDREGAYRHRATEIIMAGGPIPAAPSRF